ncbi:MAG: JAB domain-containing protein [Nitrospirota bacterium]
MSLIFIASPTGFEPVLPPFCCQISYINPAFPLSDPCPSEQDSKIFDRLGKAGELLGIKVLDSVIIGHNSYYSELEGSTVRLEEDLFSED